MLYRATYLRNGLTRSVTFYSSDLLSVEEFTKLWERMCKVQVTDVQTLRSGHER